MADNRFPEFDRLLQQLKQLNASTSEIKALERAFAATGGKVDEVNDLIDSMRNQVQRASTAADALGNSFGNITKMLQDQVSELQTVGQFTNKVASNTSKVYGITQDLKNDYGGILDLNKRDLQNRLEKLKTIQEEYRLQAEEAKTRLQNFDTAQLSADLRQEIVDLSEDEAKNRLKQLVQEGIINKTTAERLSKLKTIANYDEAADQALNGIIAKTQKRLDLEDSISKNMGVAGALVEGTGALMERLGMRSGIFHDAMKDAAQEMRDMAKAAGENVTFMNKLNIAAKGFSVLAKGFSQALRDPSVIVGSIFKGFLDVNKAATEAARYTGVYNDGLEGGLMTLASTKDILETTVELTKELGISANAVFSKELLASAAELKNTMGLAAGELAGLALTAQTTGKPIDSLVESTVEQVNAFNAANKSAVNHRQVIEEVGKASEAVRASTAQFPGGIAKAAAAAKRLGMSLSDVDSIASSLMNFESSIEAELEAQLLTGRNINMAKARELALNNDLAGLGNELFKNSASLLEFGKMNRIQQEAQAKALGMTRDQLARVAYLRALDQGMTKEQAAQAANVNAKEMQRMDIQEKMAKSVERLQQAFAPILDVVVDIVDAISFVIRPLAGIIGGTIKWLDKLYILKPLVVGIMAAIAAKAAFNNIAGIGSKLGEMASTAKSASSTIAKLFTTDGLKEYKKQLSSAWDTFKNSFGGKVQSKAGDWYSKDSPQGKMIQNMKGKGKDLAESVGEKGADKVGDLSEKTSEAAKNEPKSTGKNIKEFLQNLGRGIKSFGKSVTFKDIAKIAAAGAGFLVFTLAAPGLAVVALLGTPAGIGLTALGKGIQAFGKSMQALGPMGLAYAAAGMVILAGGLIAAGYALNLAAPAFEAIGTAIKSAFEGIGTIVVSVGTAIASILKEITLEKAVALVAVGGGFATLGLGLASLGASLIFGMAGIGVLAGIAAMADPLSTVGTSLTAIAAGVAALSVALNSLETEKLEELKGLVMTTAFAAPMVAATGAITSMIQGISGGGEQSKSDPAMIEKLDAILAAIKEGGDVYIDGNKAGESLMLAAVKSS